MLGADLLRLAPDLLVVWNIVAIAAAGYGCALAYAALTDAPHAFLGTALRLSVLGAVLSPVILRARDPARWTGRAAIGGELSSACRDLAMLFVMLLVICWLTQTLPALPRGWVLAWVVAVCGLALGGRMILSRFWASMLQRGALGERVAIIACEPLPDRLVQHIGQTRQSGVRLVAMYDDVLAASEVEVERCLDQLLAFGRRRQIDRVILTGSIANEARVSEIVRRLKGLDIEVSYYPTLGATDPAIATNHLAGAPLLVLSRRPIERWGRVVKLVEDKVLATIAVILLAPLLAAIAVAVKLDSPGPVIFRQRRHGWNGSEFQVFKFRSMTWQPAGGTGEVQTSRTDKRITRIGGFLRRTSLDELPQLFNVLNGTMSLVGPRPHPVAMRTEQLLCEDIVDEYSHRHRVKPGMTGWAQITGHRGATETMEQVRRRVEKDIYYIEHWSLLFDLRIILLTPFSVLFDQKNAF